MGVHSICATIAGQKCITDQWIKYYLFYQLYHRNIWQDKCHIVKCFFFNSYNYISLNRQEYTSLIKSLFFLYEFVVYFVNANIIKKYICINCITK